MQGTLQCVSSEISMLAQIVWNDDLASQKRWCEFGSYRRRNAATDLQGASIYPTTSATAAATDTEPGASAAETRSWCSRFRDYRQNLKYYCDSRSSADSEDDGSDDQTSYYSKWPTPAAQAFAATHVTVTTSNATATNEKSGEHDTLARPRTRTSSRRICATTRRNAPRRRHGLRRQIRRRRLAFHHRHVDPLVAASSRWNASSQEDPQNLVDGSPTRGSHLETERALCKLSLISLDLCLYKR